MISMTNILNKLIITLIDFNAGTAYFADRIHRGFIQRCEVAITLLVVYF